MVTGFNTNIEYQGEVYHVQTEHEGADYPIITTFLFKGGAALLSRKSSYLSCGCSELSQNDIKEWMKEQHKRILKELVAGKIPLLIKTTVTTAATVGGTI
ncbi:MAG: hypothetical protein HY201_03400 [Nitrospirae bacterium]|nr:hypothetical protein [Candidatus Troglogloeales bacterium]MBI3598483.1 hypothetical protein [Candidatus Troglogloeales bacterium]